jgi:transposase
LPHLSKGKRGFKTKTSLYQIVEVIFYRLKTGCQWRELPIKQFIDGGKMSWQNIYYYFNKWSKDGSWQQVWIEFLKSNKTHLDLSCIQLDGSHTIAKRGGESVGYQGRKASKTSNSLFLADNSGQMLAMSEPQEGQHHDLYEIKKLFSELCDLLKSANITTKGIFLNADPGFDSQDLRTVCMTEQIEANIKPNPRNKAETTIEYQYFDEELYKRRTVIEHANAWMDSYKALLIRFEKHNSNWMSLHWMAFTASFIRKITNSNV